MGEASNAACIDLTCDDDEDAEPVVKRQRMDVIVDDDDDDDVDEDGCVIVDAAARPTFQPAPEDAAQALGDDEELQIVGDTGGQVALRDLAHPRSQCGNHAFSTSAPSTSNAQSCSQCFCFVCDVKASDCTMWGTGLSEHHHCHAYSNPYWVGVRNMRRKGDTAGVTAAYAGMGPAPAAAPRAPPVSLVDPLARSSNHTLSALAATLATRNAGGGTGTSAAAIAVSGGGSAARTQGARHHNLEVYREMLEATRPKPNGKGGGGTGGVKPESKCPPPKPMPDPASRRDAVYLGDLRFAVKARAGHTIARLQQRLMPHGAYAPTLHTSLPPDTASGSHPLSLQELFFTKPHNKAMRFKMRAEYLSLLPMLPTPEETVAISDMRVRKVTVVDSGGRAPPLTMGVSVPVGVKWPELHAALTAILDPPLAADEVLQWVQTYSYGPIFPDPSSVVVFQDDRHTHTDHRKTYAFRVPRLAESNAIEAPPPPPSTTGLPRVEGWASGASAGTTPSTDLPLKYALVLQSTASSISQELSSRMGMMGMMGHSSGVTSISVPMMVPIPAEHRTAAGSVLNKCITTAFFKACAFARPADAAPVPPADAPFKLYRGELYMSPGTMGLSSDLLSGVAKPRGHSSAPQVCIVSAWWPEDIPETLFDVEAMKVPAVHRTASPAVLRETAELMERQRALEHSTNLRHTLPTTVMTELRQNSMASEPVPPPVSKKDAAAAAARHGQCRASLAVTVRLDHGPEAVAEARAALQLKESEAHLTSEGVALRRRQLVVLRETAAGGSSGATAAADGKEKEQNTKKAEVKGDRLGVIILQVYAFKTSSYNTRSLFRRHDDFDQFTEGPRGALETLGLLTRSAPNAPSILAALNHATAHRNDVGITSINGLMAYMTSGSRPAAVQPEGLTVSLRPYQLQTLQFMMDVEAAPGGFRSLFWLEGTGPKGDAYYYSPALEQLSLDVPSTTTGGFLAETMGMGKTIEVLALILAMPAPPSVVPGAIMPGGKLQSRATLVLCAVSLVGQWCDEAASKNSGAIRMHQYYGQQRCRDLTRLATEFDLVVTTYETLASDTRSNAAGAPPLAGIHWHRIVLDEGHRLRDAKGKATQAVLDLSAGRRWMCTGTPINTKVDDLLSEFAAIDCMPLGDKAYFNNWVRPLFSGHGGRRGGGMNMRVLMDSGGAAPLSLLFALRMLLIRHTHEQQLDDEDVLKLPPKTDEVVYVSLSAAEQAAYVRVHADLQTKWDAALMHGPSFVNQHLLTIQAMIQPLRRICSGGRLSEQELRVPDPLNSTRQAEAAAGTECDENLQAPEGADCSICLEPQDRPAMTPCRHWFCKECIMSALLTSSACPLCRGTVALTQLRIPKPPPPPPPTATAGEDGAGPSGSSGVDDDDGFVTADSKLKVLLAELHLMRNADPTAKALVFTQYSGTMDWLASRLTAEGFGFRCITGSMTAKQRAASIEAFSKDPPTTVFLLSMRSGAVGINLTAASHVFLLEPCLNPALEEQAIGRAWRMGQKRPVTVKRLCVRGSVEERIMELVKKRRSAGGSSAMMLAAGSARNITKAEALAQAGSLRNDKQLLRIDELDLLFQAPNFNQASTSAAAAAGAAAGGA